jgi:hypothetical protein
VAALKSHSLRFEDVTTMKIPFRFTLIAMLLPWSALLAPNRLRPRPAT